MQHTSIPVQHHCPFPNACWEWCPCFFLYQHSSTFQERNKHFTGIFTFSFQTLLPTHHPSPPHPKKACFPLKKKCKVLQAQLKSTYTNLKIYAPGTLLANIYINQSVKVWYGHYFRCDILKKEVPPPQKKAPLCLLNLLPFTKTNKKQISHSLSGKSAHYNSHLKVILSVPFSYKLHTAEAHTQQDKNKKQKQHVYNQFFRQTDKVTKHNTKPEADVKMPGLSDVEGVSARVTCPPSGWVVGTVPT